MNSHNIKVYLRFFIGRGAYEILKKSIGFVQGYFRLAANSLAGFPSSNCFPSDMIHTNSIWTLSNWKFLNRGYVDEPYIKSCIANIRNHTMVTHDGLMSTFDIASHILRSNIKGVFVETGCCKGGSAAIMAFALIRHDQFRVMHLFDSFEGLPNPSIDEYESWMQTDWNIPQVNADGSLVSSGALLAERADVENLLFNIVGYPKDKVLFHVGWFQDTVPSSKDSIGDIALLRLDGDLYESTLVCLRNLYPLVVRGGFIIIDDYGLKGCRMACDDYFEEINIRPYLSYIDGIGRYFIKI